jgi:hypothetical protein
MLTPLRLWCARSRPFPTWYFNAAPPSFDTPHSCIRGPIRGRLPHLPGAYNAPYFFNAAPPSASTRPIRERQLRQRRAAEPQSRRDYHAPRATHHAPRATPPIRAFVARFVDGCPICLVRTTHPTFLTPRRRVLPRAPFVHSWSYSWTVAGCSTSLVRTTHPTTTDADTTAAAWCGKRTLRQLMRTPTAAAWCGKRTLR